MERSRTLSYVRFNIKPMVEVGSFAIGNGRAKLSIPPRYLASPEREVTDEDPAIAEPSSGELSLLSEVGEVRVGAILAATGTLLGAAALDKSINVASATPYVEASAYAEPSPTPTATETPTPTSIPTETATPTPTPIVSETPTPTPTPYETAVPTPLATEVPTPEPIPTPFATPTESLIQTGPNQTPVNMNDPKVKAGIASLDNDPALHTPWAGDDIDWFNFRDCIENGVTQEALPNPPYSQLWALNQKKGTVRIAYAPRLIKYCNMVAKTRQIFRLQLKSGHSKKYKNAGGSITHEDGLAEELGLNQNIVLNLNLGDIGRKALARACRGGWNKAHTRARLVEEFNYDALPQGSPETGKISAFKVGQTPQFNTFKHNLYFSGGYTNIEGKGTEYDVNKSAKRIVRSRGALACRAARRASSKK